MPCRVFVSIGMMFQSRNAAASSGTSSPGPIMKDGSSISPVAIEIAARSHSAVAGQSGTRRCTCALTSTVHRDDRCDAERRCGDAIRARASPRANCSPAEPRPRSAARPATRCGGRPRHRSAPAQRETIQRRRRVACALRERADQRTAARRRAPTSVQTCPRSSHGTGANAAISISADGAPCDSSAQRIREQREAAPEQAPDAARTSAPGLRAAHRRCARRRRTSAARYPS